MRPVLRSALLFVLAALPATLSAQTTDPRALESDILKELVDINTSDSAGHTADAAKAVARRLSAAGIPDSDIRILGYDTTHQSLVARYRGRPGGAKPILLMAHLDVVDARKEDWSFDPFQFRELDGYYYGRGSSDNKAGVATLAAMFIRYKQERFVPDRDLIIVLTADEETTSNSIKWLVGEHRDLVDADFALNTDGGGGELRDGNRSSSTSRRPKRSFSRSISRCATRAATARSPNPTMRSTAWQPAWGGSRNSPSRSA
jgi:acetylornithine deacetylase/succinyl-diaminopimelate desuccinylase-like protein